MRDLRRGRRAPPHWHRHRRIRSRRRRSGWDPRSRSPSRTHRRKSGRGGATGGAVHRLLSMTARLRGPLSPGPRGIAPRAAEPRPARGRSSRVRRGGAPRTARRYQPTRACRRRGLRCPAQMRRLGPPVPVPVPWRLRPQMERRPLPGSAPIPQGRPVSTMVEPRPRGPQLVRWSPSLSGSWCG